MYLSLCKEDMLEFTIDTFDICISVTNGASNRGGREVINDCQ